MTTAAISEPDSSVWKHTDATSADILSQLPQGYDIVRYSTNEKLAKAVKDLESKLKDDDTFHQYLVVLHLPHRALRELDDDRSIIGKTTRITYFGGVGLAIIKVMPDRVHGDVRGSCS